MIQKSHISVKQDQTSRLWDVTWVHRAPKLCLVNSSLLSCLTFILVVLASLLSSLIFQISSPRNTSTCLQSLSATPHQRPATTNIYDQTIKQQPSSLCCPQYIYNRSTIRLAEYTGTFLTMFLRRATGLPPDPVFPANLEQLGQVLSICAISSC